MFTFGYLEEFLMFIFFFPWWGKWRGDLPSIHLFLNKNIRESNLYMDSHPNRTELDKGAEGGGG
jgi:hypothetical protein